MTVFPRLLLPALGLMVACSPQPKPATFQENTLRTYIPDLEVVGCGSGGSCQASSNLTPEQILANYQRDGTTFTLTTIGEDQVILDNQGNGLPLDSGGDVSQGTGLYVPLGTFSEDGRDRSGRYWERQDDLERWADEQRLALEMTPDAIFEALNIIPASPCTETGCFGFLNMNPSMVAHKLSQHFHTTLAFDPSGENYEAVNEVVGLEMRPASVGWSLTATSQP